MKKPDGLTDLLAELSGLGCYPSIYRRGEKLWRAHVNRAGNFWEDAKTPYEALVKATEAWRKAGCPIDGERE